MISGNDYLLKAAELRAMATQGATNGLRAELGSGTNVARVDWRVMYASDEADVAISMLIAIAVLLLGMAILAVPIYLMIRPTVIENSATPNLSRVVKQPLLASVDDPSSLVRKINGTRH